MMTVTKSFKTSDRVEISYEDLGNGRQIIFVHGWAATRRFWHNQLMQLSPRFRTIAFDLRGHGESDKGLKIDYSIERMSDDLQELIGLLEPRDYLLVGHSMGGAIVARCIARHDGSAGLIFTGMSLEIQGGLSLLSLEILMRFRGLAEKVVTPRMFAPHSNKELLDFVREESPKAPASVLISVMKQAAGTDLRPDIEKVRVPSLVIAGELDSVVPLDEQESFAKHLGARFIVLKGAGHNLKLEKPAEFSQLVEDFASRTASYS